MERLYRWMLKAYPAEFRREYEEVMLQLFRDQRRTTPALRFWACLLKDWLRTVPKQWMPHHHSRLTRTAMDALFFARHEASSFGRREISLEHLLLGLIRHDADLQTALGTTAIAGIVLQIEASESMDRRSPPQEDLPISAACKQALSLCKGQVTTRQLLAGIRQQDSTLAARLLKTYL